ncbi:MAG: hypothetical protein RLZZ618_3959 [Pseudomonadota bacterium]|jgi:drug/metabolite transporter (DMT)-like permease
MTSRITPRLALLMVVPPLLWAGNTVVGRLLVGSVPPLALNALRWALAAALLLPLAWRVFQRPADITRRLPYLVVLGGLGVGSYNALQYLAVQTSTPINITLIAASGPLWMMAAGFLLHREHPTRQQGLGAVFSLAGVALVLSRGQPASLLELKLVTGDLLMLLAAALWAVYSWMLARPPVHMQGEARPRWNWAEFLFVQVLFGGLWAAGAAGIEAWFFNPSPILWTPWVFGAWLYVSLAASILAYWLWGVGVAGAGPSVAAFFANLTPAFAAVMSAALLKEPPRWYHLLAFALIAVGIAVSSRTRKR